MKYSIPTFTKIFISLAGLSTLGVGVASADATNSLGNTTDAALEAAVRTRFEGDYSGLCVMVAKVGKTVARTQVCADPKRAQAFSANSTFEIGSISKTMVAFLVADLVDQGKMALSDPIEKHLPTGTVVPTWDGKKITVEHIVTHTSGLPAIPSGLTAGDPSDPYAKLSPQQLLQDLGSQKLVTEPGSKLAYSNFAMMVLSLAVTHVNGQDLPKLMQQKLFTPLGMKTAFIAPQSSAAKPAQGHNTERKQVPAWNAHPNLAGVGMVRASLDDMVAYAQASIGKSPSTNPEVARIMRLIETAQKPRYSEGTKDAGIGMNWFNRTLADGNRIAEHGGGTGGFSAYLVTDRANGQAAVLLSDTAGGGLTAFGDSLIDSKTAGGKARKLVAPDAEKFSQMAGEYVIGGALPLTLRVRDGKLFGQAQGQPEFGLNMDNEGTLVFIGVEAKLKPKKEADGYSFTLLQGGGAVPVVKGKLAAEATPIAVPTQKLKQYEGVYPLFSGLKLKVFVENETLMGQATGQGAFPLSATAEDAFQFTAAQIKLKFIRDAAGNVVKLHFQQGGNDVTVERE